MQGGILSPIDKTKGMALGLNRRKSHGNALHEKSTKATLHPKDSMVTIPTDDEKEKKLVNLEAARNVKPFVKKGSDSEMEVSDSQSKALDEQIDKKPADVRLKEKA